MYGYDSDVPLMVSCPPCIPPDGFVSSRKACMVMVWKSVFYANVVISGFETFADMVQTRVR